MEARRALSGEVMSAKTWARLHNRKDNLYKNDNPKLPVLQPWVNTTKKNSQRYVLERNPYYHRIDKRGQQLPYIDIVEMTIVGGGLVAAKANAGEVDLQARGLNFPDISILKKGEVETLRAQENGNKNTKDLLIIGGMIVLALAVIKSSK